MTMTPVSRTLDPFAKPFLQRNLSCNASFLPYACNGLEIDFLYQELVERGNLERDIEEEMQTIPATTSFYGQGLLSVPHPQ